MSVLKEEHRILVEPALAGEALERLISYYRLNGYGVVGEDSGESGVVCLTRGERGAGWYSSEMTALLSELEIEVGEGEILLRYVVDVKGQRLKAGDRAFWGQEARGAADVVEGKEAVDLRPGEAKRVKEALRGFYLNGVIFTIIFVFFILTLIFLGILGN